MLTRYMQAKDLFVASIILASIFTILLPVAVEYSYSWALVIRTLTGLAESAAFPAAFQLYKHWVPSSEKTIMITCVMAGIYMVRLLVDRPCLCRLSFLLSAFFSSLLCAIQANY